MKKLLVWILLLLINSHGWTKSVVNVYSWGGELPKKVIQAFEKTFGIYVNFSTYDSNETLYTKLKASSTVSYDVILPSAYVVERMKKQKMLEQIDHRYVPNIKNLDNHFTHNAYDDGNHYSIPLIWGSTGIFFDSSVINHPLDRWQQLWQKKWRNKLMLLDDPREVFSLALLGLGFNPNDRNPHHIKAAYQQLLMLIPNIKLFASEGIQAILIDSDSTVGQAWNGDVFKATTENSTIKFIYPKEGYVIWIDCLAIPKHAPHLKEALIFINYLLDPQTSATIALREGHAITNAAGRALLPYAIKTNPMIYPSEDILKRGYVQRDVGEATLTLYNHYWQKLKLAF